MDNWSNYLKKQAEEMQITILDTTFLTVDEIIKWLKLRIKNLNII
jgi:hypothetical protein